MLVGAPVKSLGERCSFQAGTGHRVGTAGWAHKLRDTVKRPVSIGPACCKASRGQSCQRVSEQALGRNTRLPRE